MKIKERTSKYRGYIIITRQNGDIQESIIYKDDIPVGGCASGLDKINSLQKAKNKIDVLISKEILK